MNDGSIWYIGINGQQQGPLGTQQIIDMIRTGQITQTAYIYGQTLPQWTPIATVRCRGWSMSMPAVSKKRERWFFSTGLNRGRRTAVMAFTWLSGRVFRRR